MGLWHWTALPLPAQAFCLVPWKEPDCERWLWGRSEKTLMVMVKGVTFWVVLGFQVSQKLLVSRVQRRLCSSCTRAAL
jgi:hypothetical protein